MVAIPGGSIKLRDDRKKQVRNVELKPFLLSRHPITQELYRSVTGTTPSAFAGAQKPVEQVSWFDAIAFCNQLSVQMDLSPCYTIAGEEVTQDPAASGFRLPTDAQWEYACRAGTGDVHYGETLAEIAWYAENADESTHDVGQKRPNPWGLYDMLGNVWEWCWDLYDPEEYGTYRIFRGGGWADPPRGCLASNRRRSHPTFQIDDLGFRIAKTP